MSLVLEMGDRTFTASEVLSLLAEYQIVPQLIKEMVIDSALAQVECTKQEEKLACEQLAQQYQLNSEAVRQLWLQQSGITSEKFDAMAIRQFKIEKFKQITWEGDIESYFLQRKPQLDRVVYSLITTQDIGIAQELFFRIQEQEQTFAELAREYSQGPEAQTDGLVGPVELQTIHPSLAQILSLVQPQQLIPPTQIGDWILIVRLEKLLPAKLDRSLRQRLLNERFQNWLQTQVAAEKWEVHPSKVVNLI